MKQKTIMHNKSVAEQCFGEIFKSIQLSSLYVLYYNMDFSKQKIKNFNKFITQENETASSLVIEQTEIDLKENGFDCEKEVQSFPFRAKLKMVGKIKPKDMDVAVHNINDSMQLYLVLAIRTLKRHYKFNAEQINEWWSGIKEFSMNYSNGMTDYHVFEYFKKECDLEITE